MGAEISTFCHCRYCFSPALSFPPLGRGGNLQPRLKRRVARSDPIDAAHSRDREQRRLNDHQHNKNQFEETILPNLSLHQTRKKLFIKFLAFTESSLSSTFLTWGHSSLQESDVSPRFPNWGIDANGGWQRGFCDMQQTYFWVQMWGCARVDVDFNRREMLMLLRFLNWKVWWGYKIQFSEERRGFRRRSECRVLFLVLGFLHFERSLITWPGLFLWIPQSQGTKRYTFMRIISNYADLKVRWISFVEDNPTE